MEEESTRTVMAALRQVIEQDGKISIRYGPPVVARFDLHGKALSNKRAA